MPHRRTALGLGTALLLGLLSACGQNPVTQNPVTQNPVQGTTDGSPTGAASADLSRTIVVGLKDPAQAEAVAASVGGSVLARLPELGAVLIGLAGPRPDPQAAALTLLAGGAVVYAAPQTTAGSQDPLEQPRTPGLQPQALDAQIDPLPQYSLDASHLNVRAAWTAGLRGAGVTVGVVDTPVDLNHPDLAARWAGRAYDPLSGTEYTDSAAWTAAVSRMTGGLPGPGEIAHGTAVASAAVAAQNGQGIVGVAPEARFLNAAVFQPGFVGSFAAARAIVWSVDAGAKVVNLSWGSAGYDPLVKAATDYALAHRVTVVAAAGNSGQALRQGPAMYPGVLASVASDLAGNRATFSTVPPGPTPLTPGVDLLLASPGWSGTGGSALYSGTSFSTPLLAGGAALLLGAEALDPYQVRTLLLAASRTDGTLDLGRLPALLAAPAPAAGAEAHLSVQVQTAAGPVPALLGDLTLASTDPAGPVYLAQTDGQGQAAFYAVQPGTYRVMAAAPDLSVTGGQAGDRGSLSAVLTLTSGTVTTQTYTLARGAVNLHPVDPYEPNDTPDTATPITYGTQTKLAYISGQPRDVDFFSFQGQAGDTIRADIAAKGNSAVGGQLDSVLVLRDPAGKIVGYDDDYTGPDSRLESTLATSGRYTLEVSSFRILGPSEGTDPAQGQPDDSPFNRYRLTLQQLNAPGS